MRQQKRKYNIIPMIILIIGIILMILSIGVVLNKKNHGIKDIILNHISKEAESDVEKDLEIKIRIFDNTEAPNLKAMISIESANGIEYIETPEKSIIYGSGNKNIGLDGIITINKEYVFKIKEIDKEIIEKKILVDEQYISNLINVEEIETGNDNTQLRIYDNISKSGYNINYKIGDNGTWKIYDGNDIIFSDYDVAGLTDENRQVTVHVEARNNNNSDKIIISKKYDVEKNYLKKSISRGSTYSSGEVIGKGYNYTIIQFGQCEIIPSKFICDFRVGNYDAKLASTVIYTVQGYRNQQWETIFSKQGTRHISVRSANIFNGTYEFENDNIYNDFRVLLYSTDNERYYYAYMAIEY